METKTPSLSRRIIYSLERKIATSKAWKRNLITIPAALVFAGVCSSGFLWEKYEDYRQKQNNQLFLELGHYNDLVEEYKLKSAMYPNIAIYREHLEEYTATRNVIHTEYAEDQADMYRLRDRISPIIDEINNPPGVVGVFSGIAVATVLYAGVALCQIRYDKRLRNSFSYR